MGALPTGTVTFLFTDIEGSTTLLQRLGDRRYAEVLAEHRRLLRESFAKGSGQEIDTQGDAFLVAFSRARDALGTAVAAQRALTKHAWPDGASLRVRMGLHTGEPVSETGGYVGLDVHRASRICSAGHGGQILLSDAVSSLAARDLPPGVSLRDLGTHRLKDLREPEHLFQVMHPDLRTEFLSLKSLDVLPNNLPVQLTSFIGREREKAEVNRLVSTTRFLTLTGSGGAGKTRLALQVAAEVLEEFPDGVWLVELAALSDPSLVPKTVASALGVPEQPGGMLTETLADALRGKSVLIILDNCEHLVAACAHLTDALLRACPNLRILATSREALGVTGETTWRVPSLAVPEDLRHLPPSEELVLYDAVRLFVDRAVAITPGFTVTSENAPAVAQVCQQLDGIPLAIELAAARIKVLAVEQIAARLDDRFRLLTGGSRTALPRQQTLRATMDWSYALLSEEERAVLRRLSVFAGGWTLEAAEAVCPGDGIEAINILDLLTQLVDKSLVLVETRGRGTRYRLLETVRKYGHDRLLESKEVAAVRKRHRDWCLELVAQAAPELAGLWMGRESHVWLERLGTEHDNLRGALEWSKTEPGGGKAESRLAAALWRFWFLRSTSAPGILLPRAPVPPRTVEIGWRRMVRRFRSNPMSMLGLVIVAFFVAVALLAPFLTHSTQRNPYMIPHEGYASEPRPPGPGHPFGTTEQQFDLYYGVVWGARTAFVVALTIVASAVAIALVLGSLSGFHGGWIDEVVMRVTDIFLAFPGLILAVVIVAVLGQSIRNAVIAIAIVEWPTYTRLLRGEFLRVRDIEYVQAARALGSGNLRIVARHVVPNTVYPILIVASLSMGGIVITFAALSFLGLGAPPGYSDWGQLINLSHNWIGGIPGHALEFWYTLIVPGAAIFLFVLGWNLLGDAFRDIFDPRLQGSR